MAVPPVFRIRVLPGLAAAALCVVLLSAAAGAQTGPATVRVGFQRSSTLTAVLKENGELERALAPLQVKVAWSEFTSGLPLLESLNVGNIDFSADVADTVPIFAQAAGARLVYVADEAPSPTAQAVVVLDGSPIRALADLRGRKIAVTKGAGSHFLLLAALNSVGLGFKDITPAYLTPADGRAALVSGAVDAWVAWDPFLSSAERQSGARVVADGTKLASYKRYYLSSDGFAARHAEVLQIIFDRLAATGRWVKQNPQAAAGLLAAVWGIDAATVAQANSHRSYTVGAVTASGLAEQQTIADAFFAEGLIPRKVNAADVAIWSPRAAAVQ